MKPFKDEDFIRAKRSDGRIIPMSKYDIRRITMEYLRLKPGLKMLDIGAGTGSLSCEAARRTKSPVIAIEKEYEAAEIIKRNGEKLNLDNIEVLNEPAAEVFKKLGGEYFDRIIIGGSGGELETILEFSNSHLTENGIIVANFITLENTLTAYDYFLENSYEVELRQVSIAAAKRIGGKTMLIAENPVFILNAERNG